LGEVNWVKKRDFRKMHALNEFKKGEIAGENWKETCGVSNREGTLWLRNKETRLKGKNKKKSRETCGRDEKMLYRKKGTTHE